MTECRSKNQKFTRQLTGAFSLILPSWKLAEWLLIAFVIATFLGLASNAAEVLPPKPQRYFNDYAGVVSQVTENSLNQVLEDFERKTSSQVVVAVFQKMQSDSSIEDYTVRVAESWRVGQQKKDNGAVLFVFIQDRSMFIQVGYGLEGALTDALAKTIIESEIKPRFQAGDYDAGFTAGVNAILQAIQGEYRGTGRTVAEQRGRGQGIPWVFIILFIFFLIMMSRRSRGVVYGGGGRHHHWGGPWGGGGFGGGGVGGFSGGSFSGGGGSFGGGGAGGRW